MKKIKTIRQGGSCRRLVKRILLSWVKQKNCQCWEGIEKILEIVKDMQGSLEIMASEMARRASPRGRKDNLRTR